VRPELTEGPYYVDEELNRSDIRSDPSSGVVQPGALLALTFNVSSAASKACTPLANAVVDVWHCNALGVYSDVSDPGFSTTGQKFLRGYQVTGSDGVARFATIYPGWYQGRTVHIHFKVRSSASSGSAYEFTSQLFFDDALTDHIHAQQPYASKGQRDLRNAQDGIYHQGGSQLVLRVSQTDQGYAATFDIALDNS
jgi:protocatechuate 3,4-dioxygenase beta subunit